MTTSLAAQLKKLATPEAQSLLTSRDHIQASFLFDNKEAATFDRQHFYNIGINGLQQLIIRDERFREFENNLFSPSSQNLQRFVQTSETNRLLDEGISKFLLRLSPYMQLREAHKAMEWMVNRYNVHLRNVDAFMMCVLPYHDQESFILALRLLKLDSNDCAKWRWLEPVKKGGVFLAKDTLITHCRAARGFLGFMCDMLSKHIEANTDESGTPSARHLQRIISFYTQTVLAVLITRHPNETMLSTLIPAITTGLQSHDLPDYMVSSYMILSQLFQQTTLTDSILQSFLNVIAKNVQASLLNSALKVIIIMFQRQSITKVTKKAFRYLSKHSSLPQLLAELNKQVNTEPFLTPFMDILTKKALKGSSTGSSAVTSDSNPDDGDDNSTPMSPISFLLDILKELELEQKTIKVVARAVLNWFKNHQDGDAMDIDGEVVESSDAFKVYRLLEIRFSNILDQVIAELTSTDESGTMSVIVRNLFELSVSAIQQDLTSDPISSLTICLHHRSGLVRRTAVEKLLQDTTIMEDRHCVQSALTMRLLDDDPTVVNAVLDNSQRLWELFEDKTLLYQTLQKKLVTGTNRKSKSKVQSQILQALCYMPEGGAPGVEITAILISFLVTQDGIDASLLESLLTSPITSWNMMLAQIKKDWLPEPMQQNNNDDKEDTLAKLCIKLVDTITSFLMANTEIMSDTITSLYSSLKATPIPGALLLVILLVTESLVKHVQVEDMKVQLQRQLVWMLSDVFNTRKHLIQAHNIEQSGSPKKLSKSRETIMKSYMSHLIQTNVLPSDIVELFNQMELVSMPQAIKDAKFWDQPGLNSLEENWLRLMSLTFNFLLDLSSHKHNVMSSIGKGLFEKFFKVLEETKFVTKFLCLMWTTGESLDITTIQKAHILQFSQVYFQSLSDSQILAIVNDPTPVLPSLLILLSNKSERVRMLAFSLVDSLAKDNLAHDSNFVWFAKKLLLFRQEITKDNDFLPQVLKNILEGESDIELLPPKKRRKSSRPPAYSVSMNYLIDVLCSSKTSTATKAHLLSVLHLLDTAESFLPLMSLLKQMLDKAATPEPLRETTNALPHTHALTDNEKNIVAQLLKRFTTPVAACVQDRGEALHSLLAAISCPIMGPNSKETIQMLAVARLKRKFVAALPYLSQQAVLARLLDVLSSSSHVEMGRCCRKAIKHMAMESTLITDELKSVLTNSSPVTVREAKRLKHKPISELDSLPWKRIVILLEIVQSKKRVSKASLIVAVAFQVLGRVLQLEEKGSGEYIKQLLLGTVNYICSRNQDIDGEASQDGSDGVNGEHLNTDLIVQCIRSSDNPHTHHQALLLLSTAAKISPDLLLHNMMSVFTFMGASILRQDDSYSFHVIGRILENVIPALITACEEKSKDKHKTRQKTAMNNKHSQSEDMMTAVLHVFVDAIPYIPAHRKIMLFEKLLTIVGPDKYLWRLLLLVIESVTVRGSKQSNENPGDIVDEDEKSSGPITASDLEFLTSLSEKFTGSQLLQSFHMALTYVLKLPEEKEAGQIYQSKVASLNLTSVTSDGEIFSVPHHSEKQLRHFKFATIFVLNRLLSSQHLIAQLAETAPSSYLFDYQHFMETLLQFISQVTQSNDRHKEWSSNRFWRILLHKSHDLLDHIVNLLPDSMIIGVILDLMNHDLSLVQRRAVELLNAKLLQYKEGVSSQQVDMLLPVITKLQSIVQQCLLRDIKTDAKDEDLITGQTALYSLKLLCRILGEKYHKLFIGVLKDCVKVLSHYNHNGLVSASSMLCVAEIVGCVKAHCIDQLGMFMPLITSQLQSENITRNEVLLLAAVTSLQKIIEAIPLFLSPYLLEIIVQICNISSLIGEESHKPVISQKVKLICTTLATVTPTRTFLPVLEKSFIALQDRMAPCAECAMSMLKDHVVKMSREDLTTFSQDLLKFFFTCFDIRATQVEMNEADLDVIEGKVIEAFVCLVFKLSEAQFKPMLLQMYNWATDEDVSHDRVLVFYRLCESLAEKLKNLFTLFAGHILKHSASMLDINNKSKNKCKYFGKGKKARSKSCRLLCYIIGCLQKTFSYDTEGFMTKERFDIVMQALVDQLENKLGKDDVSNDRITNHVVPCLASLAAAAHDDSLWKDLNYQILLKTRHESTKVRIWALAAVDAFHKQLGEDYTQLVPETIPFMAEMMEDESAEVEKYTRKVLVAMEGSVGENLQEYF